MQSPFLEWCCEARVCVVVYIVRWLSVLEVYGNGDDDANCSDVCSEIEHGINSTVAFNVGWRPQVHVSALAQNLNTTRVVLTQVRDVERPNADTLTPARSEFTQCS